MLCACSKRAELAHRLCDIVFVILIKATEAMAVYAFNPWPIFIPDLTFPDSSVHFSDA